MVVNAAYLQKRYRIAGFPGICDNSRADVIVPFDNDDVADNPILLIALMPQRRYKPHA